MSSFSSITQYDKQFDHIFKHTKKGFACSYFALLTAWNYFNNCKFDKDTHENNIKNAVIFSELIGESSGIDFETLLKNYTNLNFSNVIGTNSELIKNNIIGYDQIFPNDCEKYVVILLKNEKYIVVMKNNDQYYLRDCHENDQQNFNSLNELTEFLNKSYQFDKQIDIGIDLSDYSSVEFLIINNKFQINTIQSILNIDDNVTLENVDNDDIIEKKESNTINKYDNVYFADAKTIATNDSFDVVYFE